MGDFADIALQETLDHEDTLATKYQEAQQGGSMSIVHLDFESRSRISLKDCGAFRYASDPSTDILMAGVSADGPDDPVYLWVNPKFETADMLSEPEALDLLREAELVYAHNAPFEMAMTWGRGLPQTRIQTHQWRCTMAMARKAGLPPSLDKLGEALGLPQQKDPRGKKLIKLFCEPQKDGSFAEPKDHPEEWRAFGDYCRQDVRTEKAAHRKLKAFELQGDALETFLFDLRMNLRGVPVNVPALRNAQKIIREVESSVTEQFREHTGLNPTQREAVRTWIGVHGFEMSDMQAETVQYAIQQTETGGVVRHVLELYAKLSYAAVKKVDAMLDWACSDGRMRGIFRYYGAGTGRWSAGGPQLHNAKKATEEMKALTKEAYATICKGCSVDDLEMAYGEPFEVIASSIRHFVHQPGQEMLDGDFNAIEGRIACWVARQMDRLEDWRAGKDQYKHAAAYVYQVTESVVSGQQRAFGKIVILAAQFGLGVDGFIRTCDNWGIPCDEKLAKRAIYEYYRPTHPKIVERWYYLDACMRKAYEFPGTAHGPCTVRQIAGIRYLLLRLPSGRSLAYPHISIDKRDPTPKEREEMALGKSYPESRFMEATYWGQLPMSQQWGRVKIFSSKIFENEVQAIAADFMAHGAIVAEKRGMPPFALIHDQGLSMRVNGKTAEDYAEALGDLPTWAKGFPMRVEAKVVDFYAK